RPRRRRLQARSPRPRSAPRCRRRSTGQAVVVIEEVLTTRGGEAGLELALGQRLRPSNSRQLFRRRGFAAARPDLRDFLAMPRDHDLLAALDLAEEFGEAGLGFGDGDAGHDGNIVESLTIFNQPPTTCIPSHSAIRAGFSAPSISTVTSCLSSQRPPPLSSADNSLKRPRTREPDITGARKRSLSKP